MDYYGGSVKVLSKKDSNILRGWSLIIICMSHIVPQLGVWGRVILPSNIAIFVFSSGYGLVWNYKQKGNQYLVHFVRKKIFSKIFLPYFFISALDIAIRDMIKGEVSLQNLWVFHNWYVEFTIFVYVSFYFVWKYCKTTKHRIVGMAGASCLYVAFCLWSGLTSTWYQGMWVLWFGMLIPLLDENLANNFIAKHRVLLLGMSILMMCLMNFLTFGVIHFPLSGTIGAEGVCLFTVTSMILIMPLFSGRGKIFRDFLEYLGENSYYCYLLHIPVCIILALWIENAWLQYLFTMVGTVGIIVCINRVKKLRVRRTK